jgi:hypothetical protein
MMAQEQFGERLGSERVRLWTSQGEVEREKLDPALCYIQITSVDAYFTPEEAQSRVTYFERYNNLRTTTPHHALSLSLSFPSLSCTRACECVCRVCRVERFIFETPFTVGGGGQAGHVRDQWKRKTILTAENHFPYVKKRIPVRHKQEVRCPYPSGPLPNAPAPHFPSFQHSSMFPPKLTCVSCVVCVCVCLVCVAAMNVCISGWMSRHA